MVNEIDTTLIYTTGDKLYYGNVQLPPYKRPSDLKVFFEAKTPTAIDHTHLANVSVYNPQVNYSALCDIEEYRVTRLIGTIRKLLGKWKTEIVPVEVDTVNSKHNVTLITKDNGWDYDLLRALANNALCYKYGDMIIIDGTYPFRQPCCKGLVAKHDYKQRVWVVPYMLYSAIDTLIDSYIERSSLSD